MISSMNNFLRAGGIIAIIGLIVCGIKTGVDRTERRMDSAPYLTADPVRRQGVEFLTKYMTADLSACDQVRADDKQKCLSDVEAMKPLIPRPRVVKYVTFIAKVEMSPLESGQLFNYYEVTTDTSVICMPVESESRNRYPHVIYRGNNPYVFGRCFDEVRPL
jgi:hypothetical protein